MSQREKHSGIFKHVGATSFVELYVSGWGYLSPGDTSQLLSKLQEADKTAL